MFFRSLFWERTVLSLLEKVRKLPPSVQADIAKRVGDCIQIASAPRQSEFHTGPALGAPAFTMVA